MRSVLLSILMKQLIRAGSLLALDFQSFRRQERALTGTNLFLLVVLFLTGFLLSPYFGEPPRALFVCLFIGIAANVGELIWINNLSDLSQDKTIILTWTTVALNMTLAFTLASLSYRQDIQYFALLIVPIFQAAFRLRFSAVVLTLAVSVALIFFWVWNFFRMHPPADLNEYVEAGVISLIYTAVGLLVWVLVNHLRAQQADLARNLLELEASRAKLLAEEKLAAVGRLSSSVAHEIRNPVAMISSALTTAMNMAPDSAERREMFDIAAKEASRLERLTTDFLTYARPRSLTKARADVSDSIAYIADVCRARAAEAKVVVRAEGRDQLWAEIDGGQLQQALLNLAMNAIDASPPAATVTLRGSQEHGRLRIEVENTGGPIPQDAVDRMFEPFFTTKTTGTGLGLAIARGIALSHGGDLILSRNEPDLVQFSILLPACQHNGSSE
jgi:signal transduction histidine kinase